MLMDNMGRIYLTEVFSNLAGAPAFLLE